MVFGAYLAIQTARAVLVGPLWWTDEAYHLSSGAHYIMGFIGMEPMMTTEQLWWYMPLWRLQCGASMALGGWWEIVRIENIIMAIAAGYVVYKLLRKWQVTDWLAGLGVGLFLFVPSSFYWVCTVQDYAGTMLCLTLWLYLIIEKKYTWVLLLCVVGFLYREQLFTLLPLTGLVLLYRREFSVFKYLIPVAAACSTLFIYVRSVTIHFPLEASNILYYVMAMPLQLGIPLLAAILISTLYLIKTRHVLEVKILWSLWILWQLPVMLTQQEGSYSLPATALLSLLVPLALSYYVRQSSRSTWFGVVGSHG